VGRSGFCGFSIHFASRFDGTLATACLDFDLHVRGGVCAVPAVVFVGGGVGERVDFLSGEWGVRSGEFERE
jgi:hypothetical protein